MENDASRTVLEIMRLPESSWNRFENDLYLGYTDSVVWMRVLLGEPGDDRSYLAETYGIDQFDVWIIENDGDKPSFQGRSGWAPSVDPHLIPIQLGYSSVRLNDWISANAVMYIRMQSTASFAPDFRILGSAAALKESRETSTVQSGGFGFVISITIVAAILMMTMPRNEHYYFFALMVLNSILVLYLTGFGPLILWYGLPGFTTAVNRTIYIAIGIMNMRFFRSLLDLSGHRGLFVSLRVAEITLIVGVLVNIVVPAHVGFSINVRLLAAFYVFMQAILVLGVILRIPIAIHFLIAWSIVLGAGIFSNLVYSGLIEAPRELMANSRLLVMAVLLQNAILVVTLMKRFDVLRSDAVADRLTAEREVELAHQELARFDRMNGLANLVSVFSHELSNPIGNVRLLNSEIGHRTREIAESLDNQNLSVQGLRNHLAFSDESAGVIDSTLDQARAMIEGFKTVAADEATVEVQSIAIGSYLERLARLLGPNVRRNGHTLELALETESSIRTVPGFIAQIVTNLVSNSITHGLAGIQCGSITIVARDGLDDSIEIIVQDSGSGIPDEIADRIFTMYYTSARNRGGTGLGLAISRSLAEDYLAGSLERIGSAEDGAAFLLTLHDLSDDQVASYTEERTARETPKTTRE